MRTLLLAGLGALALTLALPVEDARALPLRSSLARAVTSQAQAGVSFGCRPRRVVCAPAPRVRRVVVRRVYRPACATRSYVVAPRRYVYAPSYAWYPAYRSYPSYYGYGYYPRSSFHIGLGFGYHGHRHRAHHHGRHHGRHHRHGSRRVIGRRR